MTTVLIVLAVMIAVPLLYLAALDGSYTVKRSLEIGASRKTVFDKIRDFRSWSDWSPWLMHEPDTTLVYSDTPDQEDGWYTWDGKTVGAGKLTHEKFTGEEKIEQRIEFKRPFKSVSSVWWEFEPIDDNTTLAHWNMAGTMPFLFRFMAKKMPDYIGKDYDTGLYMLRSELEPDTEVPRISFHGPTELPDQTALAIHFEGHLEALKKAMMEGFPRLGNYVDDNNLPATGYPFTIYHKVDLGKMHFNCDMALPVAAETTSAEFEVKSYPGGRYYKTTLKGSYEFLELAWYQAHSHLQMQKIKPQHKRASLEVYENDPATVSHTNEIITSIYIPIK
ncbi:MAG: SRPBCC family protein [Candidatus Thiodiazotropha sp. (ex Dulcina madagascariensis)]|nr:SRPBCC family protein [Candidatus Thiodiazotropha sp. (ex Dulcina madagascariensis)]MCU7924988.1 SRPBCC family protein [Candidatus Thiodiazotropha sp. (ex Dulcina madagascariensis)]